MKARAREQQPAHAITDLFGRTITYDEAWGAAASLPSTCTSWRDWETCPKCVALDAVERLYTSRALQKRLSECTVLDVDGQVLFEPGVEKKPRTRRRRC